LLERRHGRVIVPLVVAVESLLEQALQVGSLLPARRLGAKAGGGEAERPGEDIERPRGKQRRNTGQDPTPESSKAHPTRSSEATHDLKPFLEGGSSSSEGFSLTCFTRFHLRPQCVHALPRRPPACAPSR